MEKVKVVLFQTFGDGGTMEYRDIHHRRYFVQAAKQKDASIYAEYPKPLTGKDDYRASVRLQGIELDIVESFKPKTDGIS
jgi:hypothetical protein